MSIAARYGRATASWLFRDGGRTATLTLAAGTTYTVEAAGSSGDFTLSIAPQ